MKKLTIKLKQHTPLIHFQGRQAGATLRASDVKPRLDRWLIDRAFGGYDGFNKFKEFIQPVLLKELKSAPSLEVLKKAKLAFDYSLRVQLEDDMDFEPITGTQMANSYFGTMRGGDQKYLVFPQNKDKESHIQLHIKGSEKLIKIISKNISDFFWYNNFMTRQSKGYGCFEVVQINNEIINQEYKSSFSFEYESENSHKGLRVYCDNGTKNSPSASLFNHIDLFYRSIRSGINLKDGNDNSTFYFKSTLFRYLHSRNIQWDKKTIKAEFLNDSSSNSFESKGRIIAVKYLPQQAERYTSDNEVPDILDNAQTLKQNNALEDFRDRLGLSSREKYDSYSATVTKEVDGAARIPSPILIKPIYLGDGVFRVHVIINQLVEDEMPYSRNVTIKFSEKDLKSPRKLKSRNLKIPLASKASFSLKEYFIWIKKNGGTIANSIQNGSPDKEDSILRDIYTQIGNALNQQ